MPPNTGWGRSSVDDKTKVQLCNEIIDDFYGLPNRDEGECRGGLSAVFTVLNFEEENDDG